MYGGEKGKCLKERLFDIHASITGHPSNVMTDKGCAGLTHTYSSPWLFMSFPRQQQVAYLDFIPRLDENICRL